MAKTPYPTKAEAQAWDQQTFRSLRAINGKLSFDTETEAQNYWAGLTPEEQDAINLQEFAIETGKNAGINRWDSMQPGGTKFLRVFKDNSDYFISSDNIPFSVADTYYLTDGTTGNSSSWSSTPVTDINGSILIKGIPQGTSIVTNIVFFDSNGNFVSDEKFTEETLKIIDPPANVAKFAVCKNNDTVTYVKTGPKKSLLDFYDQGRREKQEVFNYFSNYFLLNDVYVSSPFPYESKSYGSDWEIKSSEAFEKYGFARHLEKQITSSGNHKLFGLGADYFKDSFVSSKRINLKFLFKSSVSITSLNFNVYSLADSYAQAEGAIIKNVEAGEVKEVIMNFDLSSEDFSLIKRLDFTFYSLPAGTFQVTDLIIWDGDIDAQLVKNRISQNDITQIAFKGGADKYSEKSFMVIGDSISTGDACFWKGILQENFRISILPDTASGTDSAVAGIPVYPPETEPSGGESIWWRCGNQRLVSADPEGIAMFGGTNDLSTEDTFSLGTVDDTPYLDTDSRPADLTWASAYKGCIEMLQRDFPNVPIVLCSVLDTKPGGQDYNGTSRREAMALLQVEIANLYNIDIVPWYWTSSINQVNKNHFTTDGTHPNRAGGILMANAFAEYLFLKRK